MPQYHGSVFCSRAPIAALLALSPLLFCAPASADDSDSVRERYTINPPDPDQNDNFGSSMLLQDGMLFVADPRDSIAQAGGGSVRVYDIETGALLHVLTPPDLLPDDNFGGGIALSGDRVVIGSPGNDNNGNMAGTAHYLDLSTGRFLHRLSPPDLGPFSRFGSSIALADGLIAVGSTDSVYLFDWDTCQLITKLTPPDGSNESFGSPIAIDQGLLAVGARTENGNQGAVHLYELQTLDYLRRFSVAGTIRFGEVLDLRDGLLAVGNSLHEGVGAAFLFDANEGTLLSRFVSGEEDEDDYFGRKLTLGDGVLFVGAERMEFDRSDQGTVYAFDTQTHEMLYQLLPDERGRDEEFGRTIVSDGLYAAVGGTGFEFGDAGRVKVFRLPDPQCVADFNCDGRLDFFDASQFLLEYTTFRAHGDLNGDGMWDFFDVSLFLTAYLGGCP
ncbi:MAG: hypothetical protein JJ916_07705 [Phycisphaerales bacterium]|nr:hypothetical protein [Phycisphaerales bacterium]